VKRYLGKAMTPFRSMDALSQMGDNLRFPSEFVED